MIAAATQVLEAPGISPHILARGVWEEEEVGAFVSPFWDDLNISFWRVWKVCLPFG